MEPFSKWFETNNYVKDKLGMQKRDDILKIIDKDTLDNLITKYINSESEQVKMYKTLNRKAVVAMFGLQAMTKLKENVIQALKKEREKMYNLHQKELNEEKKHIEHLNEHIQFLNDKNQSILEDQNFRRTIIDFIANEIGNEKMKSIRDKFMKTHKQNSQIKDDEKKQNDQDTDDEYDHQDTDDEDDQENEPIVVIAHSYIIKKVRRATFNIEEDYAFNTRINGFYISGENQELVEDFNVDISKSCIGYIVLKDGTKLTTLTRKTVNDNQNNIKMIILVRKSKNDKENEAVLNDLYNGEKDLLQFKSRVSNNEDTTGIEEDLLNMTIKNSILDTMTEEEQIQLAIKNSLTPPSSPDRSVLAQAAVNRTTLVSDKRIFRKQVKRFVDKVLKSMKDLENPENDLENQLIFIAKLGNIDNEIEWTKKTMQINDIAADLIFRVLRDYIIQYGKTFISESTFEKIKSIWNQNTQY